MYRRTLLLAGASLGAFGASRATAASSFAPLAAEIVLNGQTYRYTEASGQDLGDYVDPAGQFVQGCVIATQPGLAMSVMFRRDRDDRRAEVVFELGRVWSGEPVNLGSYQARIFSGETQLAAIEVPAHYWFSRWRWQSSRRPVRVRTSDLIAKGLLLPYDARAVGSNMVGPISAPAYAPMGLAGINPFMGTTGERPDIGPVTEPQAEYICTGHASALDVTMAQAEAGGTIPWNMRDERTFAPVDVLRNPQATLYYSINPHIAVAPKTPVGPDAAHQPALAYLPYMLTGDPYHLETLQFQATFNVLQLPPQYRLSVQQVRASAWSLRTLAQVALVTPEATPRWFMARGQYRTLLEMNRDYLTKHFVDSDEPPRRVFRTTEEVFGYRAGPTYDSFSYIATWQDEMQVAIFGWMLMMGHHDWDRIYRWKIDSTIQRTNGHSGWVREYCTLYNMVLRANRSAPWCTSWADAWELNQRLQNLKVDDPNVWSGRDFPYMTYTRGALAIAARLNVPEADACFAWADRQIRTAVAKGRKMDYKWSIA